MIAAVLLTLIGVKVYFFPSAFTPVVLSDREQKQLDEKLKCLDEINRSECAMDWGKETGVSREKEVDYDAEGKLVSGKYQEHPSDREVFLTEKELNALLATNTDLATKLAFDLSDKLISAKLLIPVDPDFPVMGGKIVRVRAGVELGYADKKPVVKLRGISLMGVPLPNAWLGGLKNVDLVSEFGDNPGFWRNFAAGVQSVEVKEGQLKIVLNE